jgi:hypothetical protein
MNAVRDGGLDCVVGPLAAEADELAARANATETI